MTERETKKVRKTQHQRYIQNIISLL